jgi:Family of unknown function (DUF6114)
VNQHSPTTAAILTIVGGLVITGADVYIVADAGLGEALKVFGPLFLIGGPLGAALVVVMGVLMVTSPQHKTAWAISAIVLSLTSFFFAFSGYVVGIVLVVVGGVLALRYKVEPPGRDVPEASPAGPPSR